jgi:hypothetical protein
MMINEKTKMIKELVENFLEAGIEIDELEKLKEIFNEEIDFLEDSIKDELGVI